MSVYYADDLVTLYHADCKRRSPQPGPNHRAQHQGDTVKTIWKYPFDVTDRVELEMPKGARILPYVAAESPYHLIVWAEVDTDQPMTSRVLLVVGTGNHMPEKAGPYLGTAPAGPFVWHVYEAPTCKEEQ